MPRYFRDILNEDLKDPEFRKEWEALQPEYQIIKAMIEARATTGMTQKELSERTGIAQSDISKLENGTANPSIRTLQRLAEGLGKILVIEFR
ncbi:MAG: helix-turn-helix transcriptional regulator [Erysipelotrichaceae bacterium]|nr:helix-turn-helix transcriptional regulator [Erysipelotrichaceae bacterium]